MICLDIDGVVANPYDEVNRRISEAGYNVMDWQNWTQFDVSAIYDHVPAKFVKGLFRDELVMKNAVPFEDSWHWIKHHSEHDEIVLVTYRNPNLSRVTWEWVFDWELPISDIHFVQNSSKANAILSSGKDCRFFVDDKVSNAVNVHESNIKTFIMNRPYNRYETDGSNIERINSLWDIEI